MSDEITAEVILEGKIVRVEPYGLLLTAQEAYELAQAINAVLPECVQPGKTK